MDFTGIIVAGFLAWALIAWIAKPALLITTFVGVSALYLLLALLVYNQWGVLIMVVPTLSALLLSGISGLAANYKIVKTHL